MSKQQEALQLLDDLDSLPAPPRPASNKGSTLTAPKHTGAPGSKDAAEALALLDDLDQMTRKSSEIRRPAQTAPVTRVTLGGGSRCGTPSNLSQKAESRGSPKPDASTSPAAAHSTPGAPGNASGGSWGWGSVWTSASAALQQAKTVVDEQVKHLPQKDQALKWREGVIDYVKQAQLDKLGQDLRSASLSTLSGLINAVAPPISEHEVIQIALSHDMEGYDGIESIVYRAFAKILEQVEGGDLVVNKGNESRRRNSTGGKRDMHAVEELDEALKLAEAEIEEMCRVAAAAPSKQTSGVENPTTYSPVYLRIQPFTSSFIDVSDNESSESEATGPLNLRFLLHLTDPSHSLTYTNVSQSIPASWLDLWDADEEGGLISGKGRRNGEWIEDMLVEVLRLSVEVIGQEYLVARMGWDRASKGKEKEDPEAEQPAA